MPIRDLSAAARRMAAALLLQLQAILRWRPDRFTLTLVGLALLGAALILARQVNYGVGLHIDSPLYISVARHLLEGEGFVELTNKELYTRWPPLYPMLLVAASLSVFDPLTVAGPLHAAIFGLTILVAGHYLRQRILSRFLILWACLAILLSIPLTSMAYTAMSEPLFILFVTLSLLHADSFLRQGKRTSLLWAAVFTALACLTRYIGLTLLMTIGGLILLQRNTALVAKMKHIAAYTLISVSPVALWMLRNSLLSGNPIGPRTPSSTTLPTLLDLMLHHLSRWVFLDLPLAEFHRFAVALTGLALLALTIALGTIHRKLLHGLTGGPFSLFSTFTLVYLIVLMYTILTTEVVILRHNDNTNISQDRYMIPMYIPLLFMAVWVMDRFWHAEQQRKLLGTINDLPFIRTIIPRGVKQASLLTVLLSAVLSLWLGWAVPINARAIRQANEQLGPVPFIAKYADSAVFQYMREHSVDGAMVTNTEQTSMYWYTDAAAHHHVRNIRYWPAPTVASPDSGRRADYHHLPASPWYRYKVRQFIGNAEGDVYLVWFHGKGGTWFYGGFRTPNLGVLPELELVAELAEGVILKVNKAHGNDEAYQSIVAGQAVLRSHFDIYLTDNTLHYVRDTCHPDDTQARFFLHITPYDTNDLPQHQQQHGFDNLNFNFYEHGVRFDGKCLASVPLPDYPIARISTGQWIPDEGRIWEDEFPFHKE